MFAVTTKRICIFVLFLIPLFLPLQLQGEVYQRVVVKEYIPDLESPTLRADKVPLENVEVSVKGAGTTTTDRNGECTLRFHLLKEGDHLMVRSFVRPGYEILNPELLRDLVIRREEKPLEVVMISQENAIKLGRIISKQVGTQYEKMRLRELNELDIMAADYDRKRKAIIDKYEKRLDDVDQYIERLVRVDVTRVSDNEKAAFQAFKEGNIEEALEHFEQSDLISKYRETMESLSNVKEAHQKVDQERDHQLQQRNDIQYFLRAQISMLEMEGSEKSLRKALNLLQQLLEMEPMGIYQGMEFMTVAVQLKEYDFATSFTYERLKDPNLTKLDRCRFYICLGTILYEQKKYKEALEELSNAEKMMDEVVLEYPEDPLANFLPMLCHQMLGHCSELFDTHEEAVYHYRKMFELYLSLRQVDAKSKFYARSTYPRLVRGIRHLREIDEFALADSIYEATYPRVQELYSTGPLRDRFLWARFRMGQAVVLICQNQMDEGMRIVFSLLPEVEEMYKENQPMTEDFYQLLLHYSTSYYYDQQRFIDAVKSAKKWFEVSELPYNKSHEPEVNYSVDEEKLSDYKEICFMYEKALSQMPKNP